MAEIEQTLREASEAASGRPDGAAVSAAAADERRARSPWWRDARRRRMLAFADLVSALVAGAVATSSPADAAWAALFAPLWLVVAKLLGLYDRDHRSIRHLTIDEVPGITAWSISGVLILVLVLPLTPAGPPSAGAAIAAGAAGAVSAFFLRGTARWLWRRTTPPERTLVIGDSEPAAAIHRRAGLLGDMHLQLTAPKPLP